MHSLGAISAFPRLRFAGSSWVRKMMTMKCACKCVCVIKKTKSPPPGTDEVVALSQLMKVVKSGNFDRVIIDTAPTGYELMLRNAHKLTNLFARIGRRYARLACFGGVRNRHPPARAWSTRPRATAAG